MFYNYIIYSFMSVVGGGVYWRVPSMGGWHLIIHSGLGIVIRTINESPTRQFQTLMLSFTYIVVPATFAIIRKP